ncbi:unnamed protein product [marine sediment metagenome]|uniref:Metallo-beta-lactamase domain-containing protein n=1 Tax=marine sediment metagenome TaxID=412755 RepID=X1HBN0_9ZZZZ
MANCVIRPIPLSEWQMDKSMVTYRLGFGQMAIQVAYVWYIEGLKEKILVDAGVSAEYLSQKRGMLARDIQPLESGLRKVGLTPDDIDLVIITHLHSDHVAEARKFFKARFLIQKDELEFAQNPHVTVAGQYPREFFDGLNFEVLKGDTRICEEISVLSTPGHSPGGQSVSVKTAQGIAIISGICSTRENFEPPEPFSKTMPVFPYGVFVNLFDMYDSLLRIKKTADIIIPIHEPEYVQRSRIP